MTKDKKKPQRTKFMELAREHGCDESTAPFETNLQKLSGAKKVPRENLKKGKRKTKGGK